ncbi:unnamed protein product [Adineta ricciae]|uniref:Mos1 transposase HTH domain-containing protein n=1 Tax=Adineta ricciae TaxID=249248 RepID=A0A815R8N6_ADIRI|nr:unnamed protein product [Adineta ricciae]
MITPNFFFLSIGTFLTCRTSEIKARQVTFEPRHTTAEPVNIGSAISDGGSYDDTMLILGRVVKLNPMVSIMKYDNSTQQRVQKVYWSAVVADTSAAVMIVVWEDIAYACSLEKIPRQYPRTPVFAMEKEHRRAYTNTRFLLGFAATEIHREVTTVYERDNVSFNTDALWVRRFSNGRDSVEDDLRGGRPVSVVTTKNIRAVEQLVNEDPHFVVFSRINH